jgi:predicted  nucleic acid-binding Zn-ribbon protein
VYEKLNELEAVENKLETLKDELETLESEYELLDETYIALSNTYQKVNTELNSAKKNLSTSISAVFLTALIFYFIGQHGIGRLKE